MFGTRETFLIAALLCLVMFFVLHSAKENEVKGVRELLLANVLGLASYVLYAFGKQVPPVFAYEGANGLYVSASAAALVGYRRLLSRDTYTPAIVAAVIIVTGLIAIFHYAYYSFAARTVVVSISQASLVGAIAITALMAWKQWKSSRYPLVFIASVSGVIVIGQLVRGIRQLVDPSAPSYLLEPSGWNFVFLSAGALMLPVLTLGGLLISHRLVVMSADSAANRDFLTGAWSRRAFFHLGEREIASARRSRQLLSVLVIDLDNFKVLNDTYGHAAGDDALFEFVLQSERKLRSIDYIGRLGGDEFAILLPKTDMRNAELIAGRLLQDVITVQAKGVAIPVPFSIGIATYRESDTLQSMLLRADDALYRAKAKGKSKAAAEELSDALQSTEIVQIN